jgi:hypothetical protein
MVAAQLARLVSDLWHGCGAIEGTGDPPVLIRNAWADLVAKPIEDPGLGRRELTRGSGHLQGAYGPALAAMGFASLAIDMTGFADMVEDFSATQWYSKRTFLPVKMVMAMSLNLDPDTLDPMGTGDEGNMAMDMHMTMSFSQFNEPVSIILPRDAVDATSNDSGIVPFGNDQDSSSTNTDNYQHFDSPPTVPDSDGSVSVDGNMTSVD